MKSETYALKRLMQLEGFTNEMEMLEKATIDSVVPGICMNKGCTFTCETEPDQEEGYCEACDTNTVKSCLILAHLI
jgi:hypothetical protein